ncbi:unnamed protein product [Malus baccata var. baccata]
MAQETKNEGWDGGSTPSMSCPMLRRHNLLEFAGPSGVEILRRELTPVGSPMKRGAEVQGIELMQSPHKKNKAFESTEVRKKTMAKKLREMSAQEKCLMVERAIYAEDELQEVLIEYQDKWEFMEEVFEAEKIALMARKTGKMARGGGGWPSTAARSP